MEINPYNYQEYAAEWLEGSLSPELNEAFNRFLDAHPEIAAELKEISDMEGMEADIPHGQNVDFSGLKRSVSEKRANEDNFLELVMAKMDGELSEDAVIGLENWLSENPERKREAEIFALTFLKPDVSIVFEEGEMLKRSVALRGGLIDEGNLEELMVAYIEGELSQDDRQILEKYISDNDSAKVLFRQFAATIQKPDMEVFFPGRADLKKKAVVPLFATGRAFRIIAVAASVALLAGIFLFDRNEELLITSPIESAFVKIPQPERPEPVFVAKAGKQVELPVDQGPLPGRGKHVSDAANKQYDNNANPETETSVSSHAVVVIHKQALRDAQSISPSGSQYADMASYRVHLPAAVADGSGLNRTDRRLTINEFPIEQIRYFTGGGNENPGLLAELSVPRLIEITKPYERINNAGQHIITQWVQWKERAFDGVIAYR